MARCDLSRMDHRAKFFTSLGLFVAMWVLLVTSLVIAVRSEARCEKQIPDHDHICLQDPDIEGCDDVLRKLRLCMTSATIASSILAVVATIGIIASCVPLLMMCCCSSPPQNGYEEVPVAESFAPAARRGASRHVFQAGPAFEAPVDTVAAPLLSGEEQV